MFTRTLILCATLVLGLLPSWAAGQINYTNTLDNLNLRTNLYSLGGQSITNTGFTLPSGTLAGRVSAGTGPIEAIDIFSLLSGQVGLLQTIVTDASATPTTVQVQTRYPQDAVRVWTGSCPDSEPYFYLYCAINGGAVAKIQMYRWSSRIIAAPPGASVSFGTDDGRSIVVAPVTVPLTTETPSGVTGTANCDRAGPPLWTPAASHILLADVNTSFRINSTGTEKDVFVSEFDGWTWSPVRWVRLESNRSVTVRATYTQVALATYDGSTLSITAPTGSTVGGTSTTMNLTFPTSFTTTWNVSTPATFATAVAGAVSGDRILFAVGATAITNNITDASFTANVVLGNKGAEGITFEGASTNYETVVPITGYWTLDQSLATGYTYLRNLKFDLLTSTNRHSFAGGKWRWQNCRSTGGTGNDHTEIKTTATSTIDADFLRCQMDNVGRDGWNGNGLPGNGSTSSARFIDCVGTVSGPGASDQILTTHDGLPFTVYGGTYSDANTAVIANLNTTSTCYFTTVLPGTRASGWEESNLFACTHVVSGLDAGLLFPTNWVLLSKFTLTNATTSNAIIRSQKALIEHNRFFSTNGSGRAFFQSVTNIGFNWNVIYGFSEAIRISASSGATGPVTMNSNTILSNSTALNLADLTLSMLIDGNACATNVNSIVCSVTSDPNITGDYNVLDPTVDADYTAGANDISGANAAVDSNFFPVASGNCDGNGNTSLVDYIGGTDPLGLVLIYKATRISRGAREIPAVYASAALYPDLW